MKNEYAWFQQRRRDKRQDHPESDLDDRLEDGFSLLQDDDDTTDQLANGCRYSSGRDKDWDNRKRSEL